jgi:hypothetical protein
MDPFAIIGGLIAAGWIVKKVREAGRSDLSDGSSGDDDSRSPGAGKLGVDGGTATGVSSSDCGSGHGHGGGDCGGHGGGGGHGGW